MMVQALKAAMPLGLDIADGYIIRFTAVDPTSGATVTGVKVSGATVQAAVISSPGGEGVTPTPLLVPADLGVA